MGLAFGMWRSQYKYVWLILLCSIAVANVMFCAFNGVRAALGKKPFYPFVAGRFLQASSGSP